MVNIDKIVDSVSEKFGYDNELKDVLKRIIPSMTKEKGNEINQMLYDALNRVKIFVLDGNFKDQDVQKCKDEIMGDVNKHVKFLEERNGEYGKRVAAGAYVNEPVFNEDMNLVGRKAFLYVSRMPEYSPLKEVYGTDINLSHLIHELGHAWASEKEEFIQNEDGSISNNVGACKINIKVDKDKREVISGNADCLLVEEALNTIEEEDVLCDVLGIESIDELKYKGYVISNYQGQISGMMRSYQEKFGKESFDKFRYLKDREALKDMEKSIEKTEAWETLISHEYMEKKKAKFNKVNNLEVSEGSKDIINGIITEYHDVYFPDNSKFTPIQKLDNVFTQIYNFSMAKYNFGILENDHNLEIYKEINLSMVSEGYVPKNQAKEIIKDEKEREENESEFLNGLKGNVKTDEEISAQKQETTFGEKNIENKSRKDVKDPKEI